MKDCLFEINAAFADLFATQWIRQRNGCCAIMNMSNSPLLVDSSIRPLTGFKVCYCPKKVSEPQVLSIVLRVQEFLSVKSLK